MLNSNGRSPKWCSVLFAVSEEQSQYEEEIELVASEQENHHPNAEDVSTASSSNFLFDGTDGKPGLISFYNRPYKREDETRVAIPEKNRNSLLWFIGPAVLVASFVFPSLYLRRLLSAVFEDSLLTGGNTCTGINCFGVFCFHNLCFFLSFPRLVTKSSYKSYYLS